MPLSAREFDRLIDKYGFETRQGRDLHAWLVVVGRVVVRTRRSKKGSGDLPIFHSIRQQLKLNASQIREAIRCTLDRASYIEILQGKGILAPPTH